MCRSTEEVANVRSLKIRTSSSGTSGEAIGLVAATAVVRENLRIFRRLLIFTIIGFYLEGQNMPENVAPNVSILHFFLSQNQI